MGDGVIYREVVRLAGSDEARYRRTVATLMEQRFATGGRTLLLSFGPISLAKNQRP